MARFHALAGIQIAAVSCLLPGPRLRENPSASRRCDGNRRAGEGNETISGGA
jgi:hypothetical protein